MKSSATSLLLEQFTFEKFRQFTPELDGAERRAVFLGLPSAMQEQSWRTLDQQVRERSAQLWTESQDEEC